MEFSFSSVKVIGNIIKSRDLISRESGEVIGKGFTLATIGGSGKRLYLYSVAFGDAAAAVKPGIRIRAVGSLQYGGVLKLVCRSIAPVAGYNSTLVQVSATATSIRRFAIAGTSRGGICFSARLANHTFIRAVSYNSDFKQVVEGGEYGLRGQLTLGRDTQGKPRIELLLAAVTTVDEIKARLAAKAAAAAPAAPAVQPAPTAVPAVQQVTAEEVAAAIEAASAEQQV